MKFSSITGTPVLAKITITEYEEEDLPDDYVDRIKTAVDEWATAEYTVGKDVIPQRITVPVYGIAGIDSVSVEVSMDGGSTWSGTRQPIGAGAYASLPEENITVLPSDL